MSHATAVGKQPSLRWRSGWRCSAVACCPSALLADSTRTPLRRTRDLYLTAVLYAFIPFPELPEWPQQSLAHPHADRKTNPSLRPFFTSLVRQPAQQFLRDRPNRRDSNRWSLSWAARRTLLLLPSTEPSVPAHSHPETHRPAPRPSGPHRQHRLITSRPFVGMQCFLFSAFDNCGVLIDRSDLLLRTTFSECRIRSWFTFPSPSSGSLLRGCKQFDPVVVAAWLARSSLLHERHTETSELLPVKALRARSVPQPGVPTQSLKIVQALTPSGIQNYETLDKRGLVVTPLPLLHHQMFLHTAG